MMINTQQLAIVLGMDNETLKQAVKRRLRQHLRYGSIKSEILRLQGISKTKTVYTLNPDQVSFLIRSLQTKQNFSLGEGCQEWLRSKGVRV